MAERLDIVILGLSLTSSWGNGHATTYRGLVRELVARGHSVLFLERDVPWYAENRDLPNPPYGRTYLYSSISELKDRFSIEIRRADVVIVGSFVPDGVAIGKWVIETAHGIKVFYDIDTPVTLARLKRGVEDYISPELIPCYDLYLSFTGGPTLRRIERQYVSPMARPLYCSVDPALYFPEKRTWKWDFGYMGTYSDDRQPTLEMLMIEPARRWPEGKMVVAGPQYPASICWPKNVKRREHLSPDKHRGFYNAQRFTLNVTRSDMIEAGYSPSVRLFEAAACGTPIISDYWRGLEQFFKIGEEILVAFSAEEVLRYLRGMNEEERLKISEAARRRVLAQHTAAHRTAELEGYIFELLKRRGADRKATKKGKDEG